MNSLNHFLYRLKYRYCQHLPLRVPVDVSLELSSSCNMACSYCYHNDPKSLPFERRFMPKETAFKIITQAADAGVPSIKFNWKGESTLNPHYKVITKYARSLAKGGTFIDRLANSNFKIPLSRRAEVFEGLATLTKVKVSYDSFRKEVFEKQRYQGDHELTTRNIEEFYNCPERIKSETRLVIQAVRTKLNADEDIARENKKRWPEAEVSIRDMVAGRVENDKVKAMEARPRDASERQSCLQAHVRLIFNARGAAFPCCPDVAERLSIGHIERESLLEIFNGRSARFLRESLKKRDAFKSDPCKGCSSFETYKGFKPKWES